MKETMPHLRHALIFAALVVSHAPARADALVAVAANFTRTAEALADAFAATGKGRVTFAPGATGLLYAQALAGAPYDAFLAADAERPRRLVAEGHGARESRFTYALGRLVLWSIEPDRIGSDGPAALKRPFRHLALANPALAPYGAAAREALQALGLWNAVADRLVKGENVAQTYRLVATGNAELGFVALAQIMGPNAPPQTGSQWTVPATLHAPIRQDAVLLEHGAGNKTAADFLAFLRAPAARALIGNAGYDLPP